jgi:formylmethanofuran dehydrogenase subunit C
VGDLSKVDALGAAMSGGELTIDGNAGRYVGSRMAGGVLRVLGGEIIVRGRLGAEAGARRRRGTIVCAGAGERAGEAMIAGNVIVLGDAGGGAGRYNKRGTIVVFGEVGIPTTYAYSCTYRPPHVALTLRYLRSRHGLEIGDERVTIVYRLPPPSSSGGAEAVSPAASGRPPGSSRCGGGLLAPLMPSALVAGVGAGGG